MHTVSIGGEDLALSTAELQLLKLFSESASAIGDGRANLKVICKTFLTQVFKPILIFQAISTKKTAGLSDLDLTNAVGFINSKLANFMKTSKQISSIKNTKELNAIAEGLLNKTTAVIEAANGDQRIWNRSVMSWKTVSARKRSPSLIGVLAAHTASP